MERLLAFASAVLWFGATAVVVQRQRVLHRRLARLERAAGIRRPVASIAGVYRPPGGQQPARAVIPPTSDRPPKPPPPRVSWARVGVDDDGYGDGRFALPTVHELARLAHPLQRSGG